MISEQEEKQAAAERPKTYGEWRVGIDFNPSGDLNVKMVKTAAAAMIDDLETRKPPYWAESELDTEKRRLLVCAQDKVDSACMDVVKAITKKSR